MKITVLGVEIRIGRLIEFEAGGEQSKMADNELVAMDRCYGSFVMIFYLYRLFVSKNELEYKF